MVSGMREAYVHTGDAVEAVPAGFSAASRVVTAVMTRLGRAWWYLPAWLAKVLPNVDIEGANLGAVPRPIAQPEEV